MNALTLLFHPSERAEALFLIAARGGLRGKIARNLLISFHSCDVSAGAVFEERPLLPHPFGIVIGRGAVVGKGVTIYQNVTVGGDTRDGYPVIEEGVTLYANAIVVGHVTIGARARIGAHALVVRDVVSNGLVKGSAAEGDGRRVSYSETDSASRRGD